MSTLTLHLPEEIVAKLAPSPEEAALRVKTELALNFYSQGVISHAEACQMAGLSRLEFENLLTRREIIRPYTVEMLHEDLRHADGGGRWPNSAAWFRALRRSFNGCAGRAASASARNFTKRRCGGRESPLEGPPCAASSERAAADMRKSGGGGFDL